MDVKQIRLEIAKIDGEIEGLGYKKTRVLSPITELIKQEADRLEISIFDFEVRPYPYIEKDKEKYVYFITFFRGEEDKWYRIPIKSMNKERLTEKDFELCD
jgi:hypothetical protein